MNNEENSCEDSCCNCEGTENETIAEPQPLKKTACTCACCDGEQKTENCNKNCVSCQTYCTNEECKNGVKAKDNCKDDCCKEKHLEITPTMNKWKKIAIFLGFFTIFYNTAEGVISIFFGSDDGSLSLLGFGIDSIIEVVSGCLVLWRLRGAKLMPLKKERIATATIGVLLILLGVGTVASGIYNLVVHNRPSATVVGALITASSIAIMLALYLLKRHASKVLNSATLASDAKCSLSCIKLSVVVFCGSGIFWLDPELWWMDSTTAIIISVLIAAEGVNITRNALSKDFAGGCCALSNRSKNLFLKVIDVIL